MSDNKDTNNKAVFWDTDIILFILIFVIFFGVLLRPYMGSITLETLLELMIVGYV